VAHLRVSTAGRPPECLSLAGERVVVGRAHECDLVLPDLLLSRRHAQLARTAAGWELRDLGSRNGTRLNGTRLVAPQRLRDGDRVTLSDWTLEFRAGDAPPGAAALPGAAERLRDVTDLATRSDLDPTVLARQSRVLGVLTRAAATLVSTPRLDVLLDSLIDQLLEAVPARRAAVVLFEGHPRVGRLAAARALEGEPPRQLDVAIAERIQRGRAAFALPAGAHAHPLLCAPLWLSGGGPETAKLAGCVTLEAGPDQPPFGPDDLQLATAVANLASGRLEALRLREDAAERRRLDEDVRGAARIQASLLPDETPSLAGWELAGSSHLCSAVGGDYYDFAVEEEGLLLALGDVAGKGLAAALLMATLRATVRALWRQPGPLAPLVARVNDGLRDVVPANRYATLFLARIDSASGELRFVNAGHAPPLLVRASGTTVALEEGGTVLGPFAGSIWREGRARVDRGDVLVLCSDGVFEAARAASRTLAPADLAVVVRDRGATSAASILAALQAEADERLGGERQADDHTFVVVKRLHAE
jgi:sigma-B regulation protein RsbU (phosphoserine phosphatase)